MKEAAATISAGPGRFPPGRRRSALSARRSHRAKCRERLVAGAVDPDQAVSGFLVEDEVGQGILIFSEVGGDPGQREHGAHLVAPHQLSFVAARSYRRD